MTAFLFILASVYVFLAFGRAKYWKRRCRVKEAILDSERQLTDAWKQRAEFAEMRLKESLEFKGAITRFRDYGALNDEEIDV